MQKLITGLLLVLSLVASGCATSVEKQTEKAPPASAAAPEEKAIDSGPRPDWVTAESRQFPRIDYFSRRGDGNSADEADAVAMAKIVKLLDVEQQGSQAVGPLAQLTILAQWHDTSADRYWSFAGLPQQNAADYLRDRVMALDEQTQAAVDAARKDHDPLTQIGGAHRAVLLQTLRDKFQASLKVVDLTGRGVEPRWQTWQLQKDLDTLLGNITIEAASNDDWQQDNTIADMIAAGLKTADIAGGSPADFVMQGRLTVAEQRQPNNWILAKGTLTLEMIDNQSKAVRGHKQWPLDIMGLTAASANQRVLEKAEFILKKEMRDVIIQFAGQSAITNEPQAEASPESAPAANPMTTPEPATEPPAEAPEINPVL